MSSGRQASLGSCPHIPLSLIPDSEEVVRLVSDAPIASAALGPEVSQLVTSVLESISEPVSMGQLGRLLASQARMYGIELAITSVTSVDELMRVMSEDPTKQQFIVVQAGNDSMKSWQHPNPYTFLSFKQA